MKELWNGLVECVKTVWEGVKKTVKAVWNGIKKVARTIWGGTKKAATFVFKQTKKVGRFVISFVKLMPLAVTAAWSVAKGEEVLGDIINENNDVIITNEVIDTIY